MFHYQWLVKKIYHSRADPPLHSLTTLNSFKLCWLRASDTLTDRWNRLLTDVCDFTWQHEKFKGHKSGSKQKLVNFPLCSLPWINDEIIWAGSVAFFPSHVQLAHFLQNNMAASRWRCNLNFISPQRVEIYLIECIVSGVSSLKTFL